MRERIRLFIRGLLSCRTHETVEDGIARHITNVKKKVLKRKYSIEELEEGFREVGITEGDTIIVHSAWREFYNFCGSPNDVIDLLIKIVGPMGNVVMPCYGDNILHFNERYTKSCAGVITEVFRTQYKAKRSCCNHFSMCAIGRDAEYLTQDHINSIYGFDEHSPYYKAGELENSKVVFLGLGKKPKKVSLIHVAEFELKDCVESCRQLISEKYIPSLIYYENEIEKTRIQEMYYWGGRRKLNAKTIRQIYKKENEFSLAKISNLIVVSISYKKTKEFIKKELLGGKCFTI